MNLLRILPYSIGIITVLIQVVFIYFYAVDVPYWDQWYSDAEIYILYNSGNLDLNFLFAAHNEHRIVITKILNLLLYLLIGGWDPKIGMYFQAILPGMIAFVLARHFQKSYKKISGSILQSILIIFVTSLPYQWENVFWSFQNHFYLIILLGIISHLLYLKKIDFKFLILQFLLQLTLLFVNASGVLIILSTGMLNVFLLLFGKQRKKILIYFLLIQFFILVLQYNLWVTVDSHSHLKANNIVILTRVFLKILSFPFGNTAGLFFLLFLPVLIVLKKIYQSIHSDWSIRIPELSFVVMIALYSWFLLQDLAIAYGRAYSNVYSPRYLFTYGIQLILLSQIVLKYTNHSIRIQLFSFLYSSILSLGIFYYFWTVSFSEIQQRKVDLLVAKESIFTFLNSGDKNPNILSKTLIPNQEYLKSIILHEEMKGFHLWLYNRD